MPVLLAFALTGPLELWRQEIEKAGPQSVILLRMEPGQPIPDGTPHPAVLATFTDNPNFKSQLQNAQALSITYQGAEGRLSYVLLNPRQTPAADEPYVIAHEFGHLWLKAQRYPAPAYLGGPSSCLSILSGDAVQHILIRAEMDQRGLAWRDTWIRSLDKALQALDNPAGQPNRCQAIAQTVLWIDVHLGLTAEQWPDRDRFLETLSTRFPLIQPAAAELAARLQSQNLAEKPAHQAALQLVFYRLKQIALTLPN